MPSSEQSLHTPAHTWSSIDDPRGRDLRRSTLPTPASSPAEFGPHTSELVPALLARVRGERELAPHNEGAVLEALGEVRARLDALADNLVAKNAESALASLERERATALRDNTIWRIATLGFLGEPSRRITANFDKRRAGRLTAELVNGESARLLEDKIVAALESLQGFKTRQDGTEVELRSGQMTIVPKMNRVGIWVRKPESGPEHQASIRIDVERGYAQAFYVDSGVETPLCKEPYGVRVGNNHGMGALRISQGVVVGQPPLGRSGLIENFIALLAPTETNQHSILEQPRGSYADAETHLGGSLGEVGDARYSQHKLLDVTRFLEPDSASPLAQNKAQQESLRWLAGLDLVVYFLPAQQRAVVHLCPTTSPDLRVKV